MKHTKKLAALLASCYALSLLSVMPAFAYNAESGVLINEVCTGNSGKNGNITTVVDSKGEYCDWIELYNPSDVTADLTGLYITDDDTDLKQAKLPDSAKIAPKGHYIIYCAKNINEADYPDIAVAKFGLSGSGETLILSDGETVVDKFTVGALEKNITYARVPSGSDTLKLCNPTPNAENTEESVLVAPPMPSFSRNSGAFTDQFELTLSAEEGAKIYYTTDGSTPTDKSTEYTGAILVKDRTSEPNVLADMDKRLFTDDDRSGGIIKPSVNVDKATVIRAVAIKDGLVSKTATQSYFVGINNETYDDVAIISIVTDYDNLFDPQTGIYMKDNVNNKGKAWERPVHIDFIEGNESTLSQDCGMRIQGGYSRGEYQKSLRFYARSEYGDGDFNYPIISGVTSRDGEGREIVSFEKFVLRNGGNDTNYVKFKDSMLQHMVSDMDISTQSGRPCIAFINGEYWGLYTLQEDYTDDYVKSHYDVTKKNVVIIKPDSLNNNAPKVDEGEDVDIELWNETINWMRSCDLTDEAQYETFKTKFDVNSLADYFAVETYITNEDWSGKNWTVWRSRDFEETNPDYSDCKWRFMLYDTEMGAYLWGNPGESSQNNKLIQIYEAGKWGYDPVAMILYKALQNKEFKKLFNESMAEAAQNYDKERYKTVLEEYKSKYYNNLKKYFDRFPSSAYSSMDSAKQCIDWMNDFFLGSGSLPARQDYYEIMLKTLDLFQEYAALDTSKIAEDKLSKINSAYNRLYKSATNTGSSYSQQKDYVTKLEEALADVGVIDEGNNVTVTISATDNDNETPITVTITDENGRAVAEGSVHGGEECVIKNIEAGNYKLTVSGKKYAPRTYDITVADQDITLTAQLNPYGDINGDGEVSTADAGLANAHVNGTNLLEDYQFEVAEVSGDSDLSTADVGMINAHAKGTVLLW